MNLSNDWDSIAKIFAEKNEDVNNQAYFGLNYEDRKLLDTLKIIRLDCDYDYAFQVKDKVLERLYHKMFDKNGAPVTKNNRNPFLLLFTVAASVAVLLGLSTFYLFNTRPKAKDINNVVFSSTNAVSSVLLPDSSVVTLNAGSSLTYTTDYDEMSRRVSLIGEACFDVRTNVEKAFIVSAGGLEIKAVGTVFNVSAYPEDKEIITSLISGFVQLENMDNSQIYPLNPYQSLIFDKKTSEITIENFTDPDYTIGWKDGKILFRKKPFQDICRILEKKFNCSIEVRNEEANQKIFTGKFVDDETLPEIFKVIQINIPFKYKISNNHITIY